MKQTIFVLGILICGGGLVLSVPPGPDPETRVWTVTRAEPGPKVVESYGQLPLSFEANHGQTDPQVNFLSRGNGYTLFLTPTEAVLTLRKATNLPPQHRTGAALATEQPEEARAATEPTVLRMKLLGANRDPQVVGLDELAGKSNYFIGHDPKKWQTNVPTYRKVAYKEIYRGIDLIYYGTNQRQLEYDFIVEPGGDPEAITLGFEGADRLEVDAQGNLLLHLSDGEVLFQKPYVYQETNETRQEIAGGYMLNAKNEVTFEVASYDASKSLVIDPVLAYSTYLGGSGSDEGLGIAVDTFGNAYVTGNTLSVDFPTASPLQTLNTGSFDAFVTKLNPGGTALIYSTYLGGTDADEGRSIAVDTFGNAYVTGFTSSADFPTASPFQAAHGGSRDAFVSKLNPAGSALAYSTYLGGSGNDEGFGIAVDPLGNAYVTGTTVSVDYPTATPFQGARSADFDAFVTKLNPAGSALMYSTYLGGNGTDSGLDIAVDTVGNSYVTGFTSSTDFPTVSALQASNAGIFDAFVARLNPAGSALMYSTYLGGSSFDRASGIAVDTVGNAYVTGRTVSLDFPTANPFQAAHGGGFFDAFVAKLNPAGSTFIYSTYLGGSGPDFFGSEFEEGRGIAVDAFGNAYVTGNTLSVDFPTASPFQTTNAGSFDAYVAKLKPDGSALVYSTYLGGSAPDFGRGIAVDSLGNAYLTGRTVSLNFPTASPFQAAHGGGFSDAFVANVVPAIIEITIDIKPGNDPNAINPVGTGLIPVAILTTDTFDATTISPITVRFGPAGASPEHPLGHLADVDSDGDLDLVLHFGTQESGIQCGDTEASLTGETFDGQAIQGSDSIVTVGCI